MSQRTAIPFVASALVVALGLLGYFVTNLVVEESEEKDCLLGRTSQRIGDPIVINPGQYDQIVGGRVYTVTHQDKLVTFRPPEGYRFGFTNRDYLVFALSNPRGAPPRLLIDLDTGEERRFFYESERHYPHLECNAVFDEIMSSLVIEVNENVINGCLLGLTDERPDDPISVEHIYGGSERVIGGRTYVIRNDGSRVKFTPPLGYEFDFGIVLNESGRAYPDPIAIFALDRDLYVGVSLIMDPETGVEVDRHFREVRDYPVNLECHAVFDKLMESVRVELD